MPVPKPFKLVVRGLLKNKDGQILMMRRHSRSQLFPGSWEFPGGKMDKGETFTDSLVREFKEETGLDVVAIKFLGSYDWEFNAHKNVYLVMEVSASETSVRISDEHEAFEWMTIDGLKKVEISGPLVSFIQSHILNS